jgi:hypothetical protein
MISLLSNLSQISALDTILSGAFIFRLCTEADYRLIRTHVVPIQVEHVRKSESLRLK